MSFIGKLELETSLRARKYREPVRRSIESQFRLSRLRLLTCESVRPSVCPSVSPSVPPSLRSPVRPSVRPCVRASVCLPVRPPVSPSELANICQPAGSESTCASIRRKRRLSSVSSSFQGSLRLTKPHQASPSLTKDHSGSLIPHSF